MPSRIGRREWRSKRLVVQFTGPDREHRMFYLRLRRRTIVFGWYPR